MSKRILFETWGVGHTKLQIPAYAMANDIEAKSARVAQSIARANGLLVITVRSDGTALDNKGRPESNHFQTTLGVPCRGGGFTPKAQLWFSIPVSRS